jgi:hypothetical protein
MHKLQSPEPENINAEIKNSMMLMNSIKGQKGNQTDFSGIIKNGKKY